MIEIEKKFILKAGDEEKLIKNAEFLGEKKFTDTYYDDSKYSLTLKDEWLRSRDGKFELKIPMNDNIDERVSDQYQELESDDEILKYLGGSSNQSLTNFLQQKNLIPFCTFTTTRRKYRKDGFILDIDSVDFDYNVAEIEYMIDDSSKAKETTQKIIEYSRKLGLTDNETIVRGKVAEYLRRKNQKHFQALIDAKVIK